MINTLFTVIPKDLDEIKDVIVVNVKPTLNKDFKKIFDTELKRLIEKVNVDTTKATLDSAFKKSKDCFDYHFQSLQGNKIISVFDSTQLSITKFTVDGDDIVLQDNLYTGRKLNIQNIDDEVYNLMKEYYRTCAVYCILGSIKRL